MPKHAEQQHTAGLAGTFIVGRGMLMSMEAPSTLHTPGSVQQNSCLVACNCFLLTQGSALLEV